ncbi:DedA family protein [Actinocrinis puniceicyclus]|uniref:DedA family protein n=1 Tax=Actinocrinis puniceicyclus TaxID=977794 RepID=A0A8J7WKB2_9ACTN|nr:DedA family protein [Actinocrinis puniceicyclus]MBS2963871.1 DedA family protein [Actinocrinis puniceicyclus]
MVSWLVDQLLKLNPWIALSLVFLLPALEASVFLGFVLPGETAVVVGGFLAYEGKVPLWAVFVAAIAGAIIGDSVGYEVGRKWGDALLNKAPKRFVKPAHIQQSKDLINRLGGRAVFTGRWTAVLRALVPSLCGTARMRYRTFLHWNALGGMTWATAFILIGYLAGTAWQRIEHYTNVVSYALFGVVIVAVAGFVFWSKRRQKQRDAETEAKIAAGSGGAASAATNGPDGPSTRGGNGAARREGEDGEGRESTADQQQDRSVTGSSDRR